MASPVWLSPVPVHLPGLASFSQKLQLDDSTGIHTAKLDHTQTLEEIKAAMKDMVAIYSTIDIVVNNAGYDGHDGGMVSHVASCGIRHCLIEPGFFRTELLKPNGNFALTGSTEWIPHYAHMNATADSNFAQFHGAQLGDPVKGAEVIYDVITSSGCAAGRDLPGSFALGSDENSKSASHTLDKLKEWKEISALSDSPEGQ
ncbi:hypothetical protein FQN50_002323 [Emmonsiellopsis sp. PD_5]|nr:hypothetical protein FQN50_002323 [Emmonsiellopsis sp. PD_5]